MGYYTWYSMQVRNIKSRDEYNSIIQALKEREIYDQENTCGVFCESTYYDNEHRASFSSCDECKWYEHEYDMMTISKQFPDVTFRLCGEGEESNDMWREYFHNGIAEECRAKIVFPAPIEIEWN